MDTPTNPNWCDGCSPEDCPGCSEEFQEQDELMEQARLLGISAEREMALRARVQKLVLKSSGHTTTPDGAPYSISSIRKAMVGM